MAVSDFLSANKLLTKVAAGVAAIVTIATAAAAVDGRYVKTANFEQYQQRQEQLSQKIVVRQDMTSFQMRVQQLEDKLFELRQVEHPSAAQRAMVLRYQDQLRAAQTALRDAEQALRILEVPSR
jgi:hypothetical protein